MKRRFKIPIRLKFMMTFLVLVTLVVGAIAFSTATLFRDDKLTYLNGMTSMIAVGAAEEARSTLLGYRQQIEFYARVLTENATVEHEALSRTLFEQFPELVTLFVDDHQGDPAGVYNVGWLDTAGLDSSDVESILSKLSTPERALDESGAFVLNTPLTEESPTFTLSFVLPQSDGQTLLITALLRSERLLDIPLRFSAYDQFFIDSEGNFLAHSNLDLVTRIVPARLQDELNQTRSDFSAGVTLEYKRDDVQMIGAFASVDVGEVVAGANIPMSAANLASRRVVSRMLAVAILLLTAAVLASVFWSHRITRPMERLSKATQQIAVGNFGVALEVESADEMGELASSFNNMAHELTTREQALGEAQRQLVQSEKMSAFGQLGAGIAHEVKNPLAGILACAQLASDDVDEGSTVHRDLKLIEKETQRCKQIIENLLKFARHEKSELSETEVNHVIEDSIAIVNHQLELNEVKIECDLQDVPPVLGNANQLQQVFINLLINGQQAMGGPGKIHVSSRVEQDGMIRLRFADDGPGIPDEIQTKIFEPFFTTKPTGEGTGLGLSVSYGIVRDHQGEIEIESELGEGTTFVISLAPMSSAALFPQGMDPEIIVIPDGMTGDGTSSRFQS